ncbi:MAG: SDR family oxidoreductase [Rhodobacteraceae bacterium]|nr:SDR family oxidoreductase [Paracoccaceae bacterium]
MHSHLTVMGLGYSARALVQRLRHREGWSMSGTTRSADRRLELLVECPDVRIWPDEDLRGLFRKTTHLLVSTPPGEAGDPVLVALHRQLLEECRRLEWIGYLSTTAVYGDHKGAWVDENTPPAPGTRRGELRLKAEGNWTEFARVADVRLCVFRLAGIYGPGRGPVEQVRRGRKFRIVKPGQVFNRIHVADIASALLAAIFDADAEGIFNVCDDLPERPDKVISHAAKLLSVDEPPAIPFEDAELSPMARSFYAESKRVRNDRIKKTLGLQLQYPTYRSGFRSLL